MVESLDQRLPKEIVAFKLRIAPDLRWFAEELSNPDFQRPMQVRDPSLVPFDQDVYKRQHGIQYAPMDPSRDAA